MAHIGEFISILNLQAGLCSTGSNAVPFNIEYAYNIANAFSSDSFVVCLYLNSLKLYFASSSSPALPLTVLIHRLLFVLSIEPNGYEEIARWHKFSISLLLSDSIANLILFSSLSSLVFP